MKRAVIIGASSGIGRELSKILSKENYILGLAARRVNLLRDLSSELKTPSLCKMIDVSKPEKAMCGLNELIRDMGGTDLIIFCSGIGFINPELQWEKEKETIGVNVSGFTCIADAAVNYFIKKGSGHFVAISSIAALRGGYDSPAYYASKAYMSNYLEGLKCKVYKLKKDIIVTDVKPGLVDTDMPRVKVCSGLHLPLRRLSRYMK